MSTQTLKKVATRKPIYSSRWVWISAIVLAVLPVIVYIGISIYGGMTINISKIRNTDFAANTPAKYNLSYEEISFKTPDSDGITLRGWWIPNPNATRALIMVHGLESDRTGLMKLAQPLWDKNYSLLFFDLRGMGKSDTDRSYFGQKEKNDIVGAFNYVKSRGFDANHIGIFGHSMGASSALLAMSIDPEIKVMVSYGAYAEFTRYIEAQNNGLRGIFLPGIFVIGSILFGLDVNQSKPVNVLPGLKDRKIFLIHGDDDQDVSIDHYDRLLKAGGSNIVESWVISDADHTAPVRLDKYRTEFVDRISAFFDRELSTTRP